MVSLLVTRLIAQVSYRLVSASTSSPLTVTAAVTVTGNYQAQWQVAFNLSGVSADVAGGAQVFSITSPSASRDVLAIREQQLQRIFRCGQQSRVRLRHPLASTTVNDAGASGHQYDPTTNTWQFNWQIKGNAQAATTFT